jgi:predicted amidohydrolase YtcJ
MKVFADGAERCAMSIPFGASMGQTARVLSRAWRTGDPAGLRVLASARARLSGGRLVSGTLHYPPGALAGFMATALERGFTLAVHALGNEAVRVTLDAYQEARRRSGVGLAGCRIEHAMFAEPQDLARATGLGLMLSMQPGHAVHYARTIRMAGLDRVLDPVPMRTALDHGCRVAISSDGPTAPGSALDNLRAAVERRTPDGDVVRPDLAITPSEALRAATLGGAEACGMDRTKGSLELGKQADLAVLTGDPFDHSTRVLETWVAGARAYAAPPAAGG